MQYVVTLNVTGAIPREKMDRDDHDEYPVGKYVFVVLSDRPSAAEELALDALHESVPMSRPEDFDIETLEIKVVPVTTLDPVYASQP